jgi:hypothetical protein
MKATLGLRELLPSGGFKRRGRERVSGGGLLRA